MLFLVIGEFTFFHAVAREHVLRAVSADIYCQHRCYRIVQYIRYVTVTLRTLGKAGSCYDVVHSSLAG